MRRLQNTSYPAKSVSSVRRRKEQCAHTECVWCYKSSQNVIEFDTWIKSVIILCAFDKHCLNALFKAASASQAACLTCLFSFSSDSLNIIGMKKKVDWQDNTADSEPVHLPVCPWGPHTHTHTHSSRNTQIHSQAQDGDQDGVDNETASDPVHLWCSVHYLNGHKSPLLIRPFSFTSLRLLSFFISLPFLWSASLRWWFWSLMMWQ